MSLAPALHPLETDWRRVEPPCTYVERCGGCMLQEFTYADQLRLKQGWIHRAMKPLGLREIPEIEPLPDPWRYRNKIELSFQQKGDGAPLALGYHAEGSYTSIVDLSDCLLAPEAAVAVFCAIRDIAREMRLSGWNPHTQSGWLRYLTIRYSRSTGRIGICITTEPGRRTSMEKLARRIVSERPEVSCVWWGVRASVGDSSAPESLERMEGNGYLEETIGPFQVKVHPLTFVQPNLLQAERIYETLDTLLPRGTQIAWDLYCGMGLVSFYLARRVKSVYGIDVLEANIRLAKENATQNGIENVVFEQGAAEDVLQDKRRWLGQRRPAVVVVDPPRSGMHRRAVSAVLAARPHQLVYLSCGLESGVGDLRQFAAGFPRYQLRTVRAFDLFPQTRHVELLSVLERRD